MMASYTFAEQVDMLMCYGEARGCGREAERLYAAKYPLRRQPYHQTFANIHRRLRETGNLRTTRPDAGRPRRVRTPDTEEEVLNAVADHPRTSVRAVAHDVGVSSSSVWRTLHEQLLYPYHIQRVQALCPGDYPRRLEFSQWFLNKIAHNYNFCNSVLFTDEASFTRTGIFNTHNMHYWDDENPHTTWNRGHQQRFSINVWCGILGDSLLGPHVLPRRLNGQTYLEFLLNTLPGYLEDISLATRRRAWFMHDGAPAHNTHNVRDFLARTFHGKVIAHGGTIAWPARSPDLNPLDFFLWGHLKSQVYATPIDREEDLLARIQDACNDIRNMPGVLARVQQSMVRRCNLCMEQRGNHFEHLL